MSAPVRAVDRALDILTCFNSESPVLSLTQIAQKVGISKSTVHRLLASLEQRRFIRRDKITGLYRLGVRIVEMGALALRDVNVQQWVQPYLQQLSAECGETIDLAILDGEHVVYLQVIESPQRVKIAASVGQRLPAYCTASGKAFLAYLPDDQVKHILSKGLPRYTSQTYTALEDLYADLRLTRQRGFAVSEQEYETDINAIAAPVLDGNNYPVMVIAVVGPSYRMSHERMLELGSSVRKVTDTIAKELGQSALSTILSLTPQNGVTES